MNIKFSNGTEFEYFDAIHTTAIDGNTKRNAIQVKVKNPAFSLDELNALLNNAANLKTITLTNDQFPAYDSEGQPTGEFTTVTEILDNYMIKNSLKLEDLLVEPETADSPAVYVDMLTFELWQLSFSEIQQLAVAQQAETTEAQAVYTAMMTDTLI